MSWRRRTRVRSWTRPAWWTERHAVSAAGVHRRQNGTYSAPDDHFTAGPDCRVEPSGIRRVGSAGRHPTIIGRIVSPTGVQMVSVIGSTPDDHFRASPHCRVIHSAVGGAREVGWSPRVFNTSARGIRDCGKSVISASDYLIKHPAPLFHSLDRRVREQTLS